MSNFFQKRRNALGLTQRQIAESFTPAITPAAVSAWENEVTTPSVAMSARLAEIYQVSESLIIGEIVAQAKRLNEQRAA